MDKQKAAELLFSGDISSEDILEILSLIPDDAKNVKKQREFKHYSDDPYEASGLDKLATVARIQALFKEFDSEPISIQMEKILKEISEEDMSILVFMIITLLITIKKKNLEKND